MPMNRSSRIYIAGHTGLVGSALCRLLQRRGYRRILTRTSAQVDLTDQKAVHRFFLQYRPEFVFLVAAKTGGILANRTKPVDFISINVAIQNAVMAAAHRYGVKKFIFTACSCIYPKHCPQPMKPIHLFSGKVEPTNEAFSIAKMAGLVTGQSYARQYKAPFVTAILNTVYGPNDRVDPDGSHFLPAVIQKIHYATKTKQPEVVLWGTGKPRRELIHSDDVARALLVVMQKYHALEPINIGSGKDYSIRQIAEIVRRVTGYSGKIVYDTTKPDGMPRKLLDAEPIFSLGWKPRTPLQKGIQEWYHSATF